MTRNEPIDPDRYQSDPSQSGPFPSDADEAYRGDAELPTLTALTAFEATLRHLSFTGAAKELSRTQGAVSRQVALLEQQVGRELFHREHPRLRPTRAAEAFSKAVGKSIARLRAAIADVRDSGPTTNVLHLALLPTFGTTWLIPRVPRFLARHPEVSIEFTTSLRTFDFEQGGIDAAIHYGTATWPGGRAEKLMDEHVVAVCSPERAAKASAPADLAGQTLLQLVSRPNAWRQWLEARDVHGVDGHAGPRFEHHMMVVEAARAGLGIALLPDFVAEAPLESGTLVEAVPGTRFATGRSYWLVYPDRSLELPGLVSFRAWLREEIRAWA